MQTIAHALAQLPDEQLMVEVETLVAKERQATAHLIASLMEMENRALYRGLGFSSMFTYCTGASPSVRRRHVQSARSGPRGAKDSGRSRCARRRTTVAYRRAVARAVAG